MTIHATSTWQTSPAHHAPAPAAPSASAHSFADAVDAAPPRSAAGDALRHHVDDMRAREAALDSLLGDGAAPAASPGELLRLQAAVYRHAQQVDVATKVVDRATGTVRQMLMIQV
ncbi:MAG: hypothetical protein R3F65_31825 [bacterium]